MKLGEKIKLLRTEQEMTQPALAEKAGIEQSYLSKLENDKGSPSFDIINRIAMALGKSGMEMVNSLSQDYIETSLSHLPEVAAEYESIRIKQIAIVRNYFIASSLAMILGAGLGILGFSNVFFPERAYDYRSAGIIMPGEADNIFDYAFPAAYHNPDNITPAQRIAANTRMDVDYLVSYDYLGKTFTREVDGGRRIFEEYSTRGLNRRGNDLLLAIGIMIYIAGMLALGHNIHNRKQNSLNIRSSS